MKKLSKMFAAFLAMVVLVAAFAMPASAYYENHINETEPTGKFFTYEWEKTVTYRVSNKDIGTMTYGFDMDWFNEDYVWTKGTECETTAMLQRLNNDISYISGSKAKKGSYSKVEQNHQSYSVNYKIRFEFTYSNVTRSAAVKTEYKK